MVPNGPLTFPDSPRSELDRVLSELVAVANDVLTTESRLRALLRANEAIVQQLDLPVVLQRIIEVAVELVGADYGALGVIATHGGLEQFIHVGIADDLAAKIGHLPEGHGILGAVITDPHAIRLAHLSADHRSVGFPASHPPMEAFLGVPVRVRDEVYGNLYLTNSEAREFSADDEQLVTALAATAGFAIGNARLYAETALRQAWSAASAEITASLLSSETTDSMALISSRVLTLADAELVCVALATDDPNEVAIASATGDRAPEVEGAVLDVSGSILAEVLAGGPPRIVDEAAATSTLPKLALGPTLVVPLAAAGTILGVLLVSRRAGAAPFSAAELDMAADFAGQGSLSMELARARADQQRALLLEDRSRIARDLHDHVIQQLFAAGLELQSVALSTAGDNGPRIEGTISMLDAATIQIRTAIFALTGAPTGAIRDQLVAVVSELGGSFATTPQVGFVGPIDLVLTGRLAHDVVAVVREGLTNVAKHASATVVSLTVSVADDVVTVEIIDNGVGISTGSRQSGVDNLRQRASLRGGSFSLASADGTTRMQWTVPLEEVDA